VLVNYVVLYQVARGLQTENLVFDNSGKLRWTVQQHSQNPAGSVLLSICLSFEVWRSIHTPAVAVSKEHHT